MPRGRRHGATLAALRFLTSRRPQLGFVLLTFPLAIAIPVPNDSSYTHIRAIGGGGQYRYLVTSCEGGGLEHDSRESFGEFGLEIEHHLRSKFGVGLRGGYVDDSVMFVQAGTPDGSNGSFGYVNPYLTYDHRWFGIGFGGLFASEEVLFLEDTNTDLADRSSAAPTISLRLFRLDKLYVTGDLLSGVPLYSGAGYFSLGVGFRPVPRQGLWIGVGSAGPYDNGGLLLQSETQLGTGWSMNLNGRLGHSGDTDEFGVSAGVTYRMFR